MQPWKVIKTENHSTSYNKANDCHHILSLCLPSNFGLHIWLPRIHGVQAPHNLFNTKVFSPRESELLFLGNQNWTTPMQDSLEKRKVCQNWLNICDFNTHLSKSMAFEGKTLWMPLFYFLRFLLLRARLSFHVLPSPCVALILVVQYSAERWRLGWANSPRPRQDAGARNLVITIQLSTVRIQSYCCIQHKAAGWVKGFVYREL